jgi:hypothetical protein
MRALLGAETASISESVAAKLAHPDVLADRVVD